MNELEWHLLEDKTPLEFIEVNGVALKPGDRVILRPHAGGDIFDLALAGKTATIESIEQDYENRIHLAVTVDDDPGRDLGELRQIGHRFFFSTEEVEPFAPKEMEGIGESCFHAFWLLASATSFWETTGSASKSPSDYPAAIGRSMCASWITAFADSIWRLR